MVRRFDACFGVAAAAVLGLVLLTAARGPSALARTSPGLWEIGRVPAAGRPIRRCIGDTGQLARIEHPRGACTQIVITDEPTRAVIHYTCTVGGFGRTQIDLVTPRSLRIETQGISAGLPFNYLVQARRLSDCRRG